MTPGFRWFLTVFGAAVLILSAVLHMDLIGFMIGGACFAAGVLVE